MLSTGVSHSTLTPSTASSNWSIRIPQEGPPLKIMASFQHMNIIPDLIEIEKRLKDLGHQTKETSTRNTTGSIIDDVQQLITRLKVDEWKSSRPPNLVLTPRRRSSNSQNASINDVTNFLHELFRENKSWCSIGPHFLSLSSGYLMNLEKAFNENHHEEDTSFFVAEKLLTQHLDTGKHFKK